MPSRLVNLKRQLRWHDFGHPRPGPDPAPGVAATAAQTRATYNYSIHSERVPGTHPPRLRVRDDITVTVALQPHMMFVNAWVFRRPAGFQTSVLHHEQGHYDLVALFCRDMFIDLVALKAQTFATNGDITQAVNQILARYDPPIKGIHKLYDNDTKHGLDSARQQRWDRFIQTAFNQPRNPPVSAPDGTPYKVPLIGVLRPGGVAI
jgi:hypothetical protein